MRRTVRSKYLPSRRRSAAAWAKLVSAWEASGVDAETFAGRRGVSARGLKWWRWKLRATPTSTVPSDLRLVPVELSEEPTAAAHVLWEIEGPSGQVLRVHRDSDGALFRYALSVLGGRR